MSTNSILSTDFMSESIFLQQEYCFLAEKNEGRAKMLSLIEMASPLVVCRKDTEEAKSIVQLYHAGISNLLNSLSKGKLQAFDVALGDHNCHIPAYLALEVYKSTMYQKELSDLKKHLKDKKGKLPLNSNFKPLEYLKSNNLLIKMSSALKYLACCSILKEGTSCTENRNGTMVLKVDPSVLKSRLSKNSPLDLIKELIPQFRDYIHSTSIKIIQYLGQQTLKEEENICLNMIQKGKTPQGYIFQYPCAFYNMKATLLSLMKHDIYFVFVKYHPKLTMEDPLFFEIKEKKTRLINSDCIEKDTPLFVIQAFFNEKLSIKELGNQIEQYGLDHFVLANIAINPQFIDLKTKDFANDEDILKLPPEYATEIKQYRQEGKRLKVNTESPEICRIAHTYIETMKNITMRQ